MTPATMVGRISKVISSAHSLRKLGHCQKHLVRHNSSQSGHKVLECLTNRTILRVSGKEISDYLQGLITNDIKHLQDGAANIYTLFLNIKGKVMYDSIIYKSQKSDTLYIECDKHVAEPLKKYLKFYSLRRKIDIEDVQDSMKIWTMFGTVCHANNDPSNDKGEKCKLEGMIFPCGTLNNNASKVVDNISIYQDPRLSDLGFRILARSDVERNEIVKHLNFNVSDPTPTENYRTFRYKIGIAEGVDDLPPGKSFPFECNCDYLHGISFHKGCYIGQELTARTYHTGVVRKRVMPIVFEQCPNVSINNDENILDDTDNVVGKFRGHENKYGIGLMRIAEALAAQSLTLLSTPLKVVKPSWWPRDVQTKFVSEGSNK